MQPHEMSVWIPVVLTIWLVPLVASVIERRFIRERLAPLLDAFKRQSAPTKTFIVIFLIAAILHGGTKPNQSPQATSCASSPGMVPIEEEEPSGVVAPNAVFRITDFVVVSGVQAVGFEVTWASNAFDCAASRGMDVFMSTNLLTRNWFWLNRLVLPTGTNAHAFALDGAASTIRYYYDDDDRLTGSHSGAGQGMSAVALTPAGNPAVLRERSAK